MRKHVLQFGIVAVTVLVGWLLVTNRYYLRDWWVLRSYNAPAEIVTIAERVSLSEEGKRIFYASKPEINRSQLFNGNCPILDKSIVLGCYSAGRIFIYDITDKRLDGIKEVTAAHEMLHAAYSRLSSSERKRIDALVDAAAETVVDERIKQTIDEYRQDDPSSVPNELHSIIGTELAELNPELEDYYARYFANRSAVIAHAQQYEAVFVQIDTQLSELKQQIDDSSQDIKALSTELEAKKATLDADADRLNGLRKSGQITQYNAAVPAYNNDVSSFNATIQTYKSAITTHNLLVSQYNELALTQNELVASISSKFEKINN